MNSFSKAVSISGPSYENVLQLLAPYEPRKDGEGFRARCPAHKGQDRNMKADYKDGRWLFFCHSKNCSQADIEKALGMQKPARNGHSRDVIRYEVKDIQSKLWGTHCRQDTPQGKKIWWEPKGLKTDEAPLYRSQDIPTFNKAKWVYLNEGEKATDALRALGAQALGTVTGAPSQHRRAALEHLLGYKIALFPDNDADHKGLLHMSTHATLLKDIAAEVVILDSRSLPLKGDAVEWIDAQLREGKTKQDLMQAFQRDELLALPQLTKETTPETTEATRPRALPIADFLRLKVPPRESILGPWLTTKSLSMLYAKTGLGKTWVALGISYAVASGGSFLRWNAPKPRGVLYVDGEMPANLMQERLLRIIASNEQEAQAPFKMFCSDLVEGGIPDISTSKGQELIDENLEGVELLVLDNLSTLIKGGKENEAESWTDIQSYLLSLRRRNVSVLLLHHAGKGGGQRGTSKKEDALDTVISLQRPDDYQASEGARVEFHFDKARGLYGEDVKPFEARLHFNPDDPTETGLEWKASAVKGDTTEKQILALYKEGRTQSQIAQEVGVSQSTVSRVISEKGGKR